MKVAIITDQHMGVRNDSEDVYYCQMKFYDGIFFPYLQENKITTVINCGDFMDRRKYVNYKTLYNVRKDYISRLSSAGVTVHNIIGNHDCYHKNTNEVNSIQELFSNIENFHIYPEPTEVVIDGVKLLFMPWICQDNTQQCLDVIEKTDAKIVFGHLELMGFEMYRGQVMHEGIDSKIFSKFDAVYTGHYHHKSSKKNIHYLGAPCEYTWADYADDRGFHVFDTETLQMEYVRNPYRMFHKINYDDTKLTDEKTKRKMVEKFESICDKYKGCYVKVLVEKKNDAVLFEEFMDRLYKSNPFDITIIDGYQEFVSEEDVDTNTMSQDTLSILTTTIDNNTILDETEKNRLRVLMGKLYHDALSNGTENC